MSRRCVPLLLIMTAAVGVASCSKTPEPRRYPDVRESPLPAAPPPAPSSSAEACYTELAALPISFRPLPARQTPEGCGFDDGVQLLDIGVPVGGLTAMSCPAAGGLYRWVVDGVQPAAERHFGEPVVRIDSYGTYACRGVNSRPGAKLSEHAYANAVDIAAFRLASGRTVRVESGWRAGGADTAFLKDVHSAACRTFQIVIGPDGDQYHQDHIHMDMGRGPYCR